LAWLAFTGADAQHAERIWALTNVITAATILVLLSFDESLFVAKPLLAQVGLLAIISAITIVDYSTSLTFYFPDSPKLDA
jgi:hypothetical protein